VNDIIDNHMMHDDVVINNVKIMDAVFVAGLTNGCFVVVATEGRTNKYLLFLLL
jgi:hypothetical protein